MKPSDFQKTIQCQFDCKLKRVVRGIVRKLRRRRNKEIAFCEIPEIVIEKLAVWDEYEGDYTSFHVCGVEIRVLDDELAEALKSLPERERDIILMYFFLDMSDMEIGKKFNIDRSSSYRSRRKSLDTIRKKLKEKSQNE